MLIFLQTVLGALILFVLVIVILLILLIITALIEKKEDIFPSITLLVILGIFIYASYLLGGLLLN